MYEWVIVFCLAVNTQGAPVNRCMIMDSVVQFETELECEIDVQSRVNWVARQLVENYEDGSPVVTGVCGQPDDGI